MRGDWSNRAVVGRANGRIQSSNDGNDDGVDESYAYIARNWEDENKQQQCSDADDD